MIIFRVYSKSRYFFKYKYFLFNGISCILIACPTILKLGQYLNSLNALKKTKKYKQTRQPFYTCRLYWGA